MRSHRQLQHVQRLLSQGKQDAEIAALTGIPRRTVCDWRRGQNLIRNRSRTGDYGCSQVHDFSALPAEEYVYLLGLYLGDGYISLAKRGVYRLRITLDSQYPEIISQCRHAPRYTFSNRSEDIKRLFCESCDALGIRWTRPSDMQIAIYRKASVAILDEFVGPKS